MGGCGGEVQVPTDTCGALNGPESAGTNQPKSLPAINKHLRDFAAATGLRVGNIIVAIDGKPAAGMTLTQIPAVN